jgi:hypothetical protein
LNYSFRKLWNTIRNLLIFFVICRRFVGDEECTRTIHSNSIQVFSSQGSHNKGSSKLTLKNFVNFNWDQCYYRGQLIALHISEKYIAYGFSNSKLSLTTQIT